MRLDVIVPGEAEGQLVVLAEPLSFWGGYDAETGLIVERRHPQRGLSLAGCVVAMRTSRGSSSSSSVLAEALRLGTGPAALVLGELDPILVLGVLVAAELYGATCPVALLDPFTPEHLPPHVRLVAKKVPGTFLAT